MNLKKFLLTVAASAALASTAAQAQTKLAVVDLKKVFEGYWRTKQSDAQLRERAADFEKVGKGMLEDYKKATDEFKQIAESANDQVVSQDERDKRKKEAEKKGQALQELQTSLQTFDRNSRQGLAEQQKRLRDSVLRDIRGVVEEQAKTAGYGLVIDTASETANQTPVVLYTSLLGGNDDLTDGILKKLNPNAPADAVKVDAPKTDAPKTEEKK